jgi:anti-sigma factor ChrR (cupin superfamily)
MSDLFARTNQSNDAGQPLALPIDTSLSVPGSEMEWQHTGSDGFWVKPLYENEDASQKTSLMKVDPGAWSPSHAHDELEQIYVLSGSFYDEEKTYAAGDYIIRAPGAMHTAGSADGATVLLFYSKTS